MSDEKNELLVEAIELIKQTATTLWDVAATIEIVKDEKS